MTSTGIRSALGLAAALVVLALPSVAWADGPAAPEVVTQAATDVTSSGAVLHAKVVTHGTATSAYFAYGTAPDHLTWRSPSVVVDDKPGEIPVDVAIGGLRAGTAYSVVAVAENDDWIVSGDAVTVQTLAPPVVAVAPVTDITYKSATLHLTVATHGLPVTISGTVATNRVVVNGVRTPGKSVPFGPIAATADGDVAIPLAGLDAGASYDVVATATSAGGVAAARGRFETTRLIFMPRPRIAPAKPVEYGSQVTIAGVIDRRAGLPLTLVEQPYPFTAPIAPVLGATTVTDAQGAYAIDLRVTRTTSFGVTTDGAAAPTPANLTKVKVFPALTVKVKRVKGHRFAFTGAYLPRIAAKASLYRRGAGRVGTAVSTTGRFAFAARPLKPGKYEVRIAVPKTAGLESVKSKAITIPRR
ncbi:MAG: hypothetical protein JWR63_2352 [Conexibacter sp.]|nr:hypothetical protein [Conexibacter sp.]